MKLESVTTQTPVEVDPLGKAARVSLWPQEYIDPRQGQLGHYRCRHRSGAIAPVGNAVMATFRWTDPTNECLITRIEVRITVATAVTAQRTDPITATIRRAYTTFEDTNLSIVTIN